MRVLLCHPQEQLRLRGEREEYVLKVSMLELYNETLRDLIAPPGPLDRFGRPTGPNQLLLQVRGGGAEMGRGERGWVP